MIEYSRQTGHWRMSPSALAFARSAGRLLCAAETEIKTIVANGALLRMLTLPRSTLERRLPLLKESTGKEYLISAPPAAASTVAPRLAGQLSQKWGPIQLVVTAGILAGRNLRYPPTDSKTRPGSDYGQPAARGEAEENPIEHQPKRTSGRG